MVEEDLTMEDLCQPPKPGHILFPEGRNMSSAINICSRMRAEVSVVSDQSIMLNLNEKLKEVFPDTYKNCKKASSHMNLENVFEKNLNL